MSSVNHSSPPYSSGLTPSLHQAAGHAGSMTLQEGSLFVKPTSQQELDFYSDTYNNDAADGADLEEKPVGSKLVDWLPVYMGKLHESNQNAIIQGHAETTSENVKGGFLNPSDPLVIQKSVSELTTNDTDKEYIVLQNLYHGFTYPSILDIKLGSKLTDDSVTAPEKIARLQKVSESTTTGSLSFRICGMKVYCGNSEKKPTTELYPNMNSTSVNVISHDSDNSNYLEFNKFFGRSLDKRNIKQGLLLFFNHHLHTIEPHGKKILQRLLESTLKRLQLLYNCLLDYEIRVFSGSLLFIYENDLTRWLDRDGKVLDDDSYYQADPLIFEPLLGEDSDEEDSEDEGRERELLAPLSTLKMIDFAHAKFVHGQGHDENILEGLENLIEIFESLIDEETSNEF
ncbi:hypothetical protein G9P44_003668 [Scheffersomyces stipitis]|nr:hypothetical protein G9P44_003668 [Scheffersomyces stipitis]